MARLDRLLTVVHEYRAEGLHLGSGFPARVKIGGGLKPVTKEILDAEMIRSLLQEIAAPEVVTAWDGSEPLSFGYQSPSGQVQVAVTPTPHGIEASLRFVTVTEATISESDSGMNEAREAITTLLRKLFQDGGSDLHLRSGEPPLIRKDGALLRVEGSPLSGDYLFKMLASIMSTKDRETYRSDNDADWAFEIEGVARFRCNAGQDRNGPMAVFRVIPSEILTADQLGISREVQQLCDLTKGLVLVTGPTGSGKSTTLAAMIDLINRTRSDHVITIEDPIEFVHPSKSCLVTQRQVGLHTRSFKAALRAALREDPDVILVGELRDLETISIAIETAETGHLVFGTLHTTTAASTLDRIIDQFPADRQAQVRVMLSESLRGVVAQVLCRKIGGGRVAAREILLTIPAISNLIREGKTFQIPSIMQTNKKLGMVMLNDALLDLVDRQLIEPQQAYLKSVDKATVLAALKHRGVSTAFLDGE